MTMLLYFLEYDNIINVSAWCVQVYALVSKFMVYQMTSCYRWDSEVALECIHLRCSIHKKS